MVKQQRILWTALPNGIYTDKTGKRFLRISAHISPRLYGDAPTTLGDPHNGYPDFLSWPQIVSGMLARGQFQVSFSANGKQVLRGAVHDPNRPAPDGVYYGALFTGATPVQPYAPTDLSNRFVVSHPARQIHEFLHTGVGIIADRMKGQGTLQTQDYLDVYNPGGSKGPFAGLNKGFADGSYHRYLHTTYSGGVPTNPPTGWPKNQSVFAAQTHSQFQLLRYFHFRNTDTRTAAGAARVRARQAPHQDEPDFHRAVSALGKHPTVMRLLGFVVDLLVAADGLPQTADGLLQMQPLWKTASGIAGDPILSQVHYIYDGTQFRAKAHTDQLADGMLNLDGNGDFGISHIDVDGGGLKLAQFVQSLTLAQENTTRGVPDTAHLPALRSAGLQVLKAGRAVDLADRFKRVSAHHRAADTGAAPEMYAEDITLGYRVDVYDTATRGWRSLHHRTGTYHFLNAKDAGKKKLVVQGEEGFVSLGAISDPSDTSGNPDLYLHESMFRWNGWSLAVPIPGKAIGEGDAIVTPSNAPGKNFQLSVNWTDDGTYTSYAKLQLPRLRFGWGYQVRARAVDLAGNSLPPDMAGPTHAAPHTPAPYLRYEPVTAPVLAQLHDSSKSPGEALERMVVRSDYKVAADDYPARFATYNLSNKSTLDVRKWSQRHVFPPKTSEELAERHGALDTGPKGEPLDERAYDNLAGSGKGLVSLDSPLAAYLDDPNSETNPDESKVTVPYLPDVLARGVQIEGLPGGPDWSRVPPYPQLTFDGWPFVKPFRIILHGLMKGDQQRPAQWDAARRLLHVYLRQAETQEINLSSWFHGSDLDLFGVWKWIEDYYASQKPPVPVPDELRQAALAGRLPLLSPSRAITLVHAVQRPLVVPTFGELRAVKTLKGQTFADLYNVDKSGRSLTPVPVDGASTMKLDVYGDWKLPVDDGVSDLSTGFHTIHSHDHVFEARVTPDDTSVDLSHPREGGPGLFRRHQFYDTKHRTVTYTAVATTRFRDYFGFAEGDLNQHDQTNPRKVSITQVSPPVTASVPSSARPDAPKVLYVVPAFGWETPGKSGNAVTDKRHGGWVRVWMDRPWYSSGDGELLGVVLPSGNSTAAQKDSVMHRFGKSLGMRPRLTEVNPTVGPYVTQVGRDLTRASLGGLQSPTQGAFPPHTPYKDGLTLDESPGPTFAVAGHTVHFDGGPNGRKLWYADIQMDFDDAYFPFVRLALARYQPNSVPGVELSRVVQADFVQVAPDRFATLTTQSGSRQVQVVVTGPGYYDPQTSLAGTTMEVTVEQQRAGIEGDLGWAPVPHGDFTLASQPALSYRMQWQGTITLPRPAGSAPYRLVIKEYELFQVEGQSSPRRLVYATAVAL